MMSIYISPSRLKWILAGASAAVVLSLDVWTKQLAQDSLAFGEKTDLLLLISLQRTGNTGAAFGLLSGHSGLIAAGAAVALLIVAGYIALEEHPTLGGVAGGFVIGGSVGNLVERLTIGHVTDFIRLPYWPHFNLADIFIVLGVGLMMVGLLVRARSGRDEGRADGDRRE